MIHIEGGLLGNSNYEDIAPSKSNVLSPSESIRVDKILEQIGKAAVLSPLLSPRASAER